MKLVALTPLSDAQLQEVKENTGKGKPPVYKTPIRAILAHFGDAQGTLPVAWSEINPDAKKRQTVITGVKNVLRTDSENGKEFARIVGVFAGTDAGTVMFAVKAAPKPEQDGNTEAK